MKHHQNIGLAGVALVLAFCFGGCYTMVATAQSEDGIDFYDDGFYVEEEWIENDDHPWYVYSPVVIPTPTIDPYWHFVYREPALVFSWGYRIRLFHFYFGYIPIYYSGYYAPVYYDPWYYDPWDYWNPCYNYGYGCTGFYSDWHRFHNPHGYHAYDQHYWDPDNHWGGGSYQYGYHPTKHRNWQRDFNRRNPNNPSYASNADKNHRSDGYRTNKNTSSGSNRRTTSRTRSLSSGYTADTGKPSSPIGAVDNSGSRTQRPSTTVRSQNQNQTKPSEMVVSVARNRTSQRNQSATSSSQSYSANSTRYRTNPAQEKDNTSKLNSGIRLVRQNSKKASESETSEMKSQNKRQKASITRETSSRLKNAFSKSSNRQSKRIEKSSESKSSVSSSQSGRAKREVKSSPKKSDKSSGSSSSKNEQGTQARRRR